MVIYGMVKEALALIVGMQNFTQDKNKLILGSNSVI